LRLVIVVSLLVAGLLGCSSSERSKEGLDSYYVQQTSAESILIAAGAKVNPEAVQRASDIVTDFLETRLACRLDLRTRLKSSGLSVAIIGQGERITDLPEERHLVTGLLSDNTPYIDVRAIFSYERNRPIVSEEYLLGLREDKFGLSALYHEMAHALDYIALREEERSSLMSLFEKAKLSGLWHDYQGNALYGVTNHHEYFAVSSEVFLGVSNSVFLNNRLVTKEGLEKYDNGMYQFLSTIYCN
jgi:hypothetical protein